MVKIKPNKVFICVGHFGSYDSYIKKNLKCFSDKRGANEFKKEFSKDEDFIKLKELHKKKLDFFQYKIQLSEEEQKQLPYVKNMGLTDDENFEYLIIVQKYQQIYGLFSENVVSFKEITIEEMEIF